MDGWEEETWYWLYESARLSETLNHPEAEIVHRYLQAYQYRPSRAEPLVRLARFHRERGQYALARLYAARAVQISKPADLLFVEDAAYGWQALDEYALAAYWTGDYAIAEQANRELLASTWLPLEQRSGYWKTWTGPYASKG